MSNVPDGFDLVRKVVRGLLVKCRQCGREVHTRWGLARKHSRSHQSEQVKPDADRVA